MECIWSILVSSASFSIIISKTRNVSQNITWVNIPGCQVSLAARGDKLIRTRNRKMTPLPPGKWESWRAVMGGSLLRGQARKK